MMVFNLSFLRGFLLLFGLLVVFLVSSLWIISSGAVGRLVQHQWAASHYVVVCKLHQYAYLEYAVFRQIADLQTELRQMNVSYTEHEKKLYEFGQQLINELKNPSRTASSITAHLENIEHLLNATSKSQTNAINPSHEMRLPTSFDLMPHLNSFSLKPAYALSKGRKGVSVALGVPTVNRANESYLISTLQNLIGAMSQEEEDDTIIIVFIAETIEEYIHKVANNIKHHLQKELDSGLLEVIAPSSSYYPDMTKLRMNFGDDINRVRWRTKQNLDFAYLMMYSQPKALLYVQLEDDLLVKEHFITSMITKAKQMAAKGSPWFVLDFCKLGFIGKLFKSSDLPQLALYILMFFDAKPVDWLLEDFMYGKVCRLGNVDEKCKKEIQKLRVLFKPSLFQHIGTQSSLKGKVQLLKDTTFGETGLYFPHTNPDPVVVSELAAYKFHNMSGLTE